MTALTVWHYDTPFGAEAGGVRLRALEERLVLTVHDAITVAWMPRAEEPVISHLHHPSASSAGKGSVLGGLVGLVVLAPLAGAAAGAGIAAAMSRLSGAGIDRRLVEEMEKHLTPGSSALLVLSSDADLDELRPVIERELERGDVALLHAELSEDAPAAVREVVDDLERRGQGP
ncbi:DUF1269 domain-containing protein [Nocardioides sp. zg-1308]|uniref:DUF1269 domain-containing protein n=1 Tax=Nocardioides TaxID=1839 RepID=UPI00155527F3|nr:DUF1269 domain-containing protein [Nocardioides sp. S-34]NPD06115.1 DUF1269 domain-containing protein [Nocardioides sp. zg-1308]WQQ20359.1 DUF1269 domain-containing protein [Nocardioides sp. S-34]